MVDISLYNKWRPHQFSEIVGQDIPVGILKGSITNNRLRQAYLLYGMHGSGKTTLARIFAAAINCQHPNPQVRPCGQCQACLSKNMDIVEIDAATNTSIDDVRALRERIQYLPEIGRKRIYIIDEIHRFSGSAFDALLKMIEEPPPHVIFMMATTELEKIPDTIKSRCILIPFYPASIDQIEDHLHNISVSENISIERQALHVIAMESKGSMRDAIKLLDQLVIDPKTTIRTIDVQRFTGVINRDLVKRIIYAIVNGRSKAVVDSIRQAINDGAIPTKLAQQIAEAAHSKLIYALNNNDNKQYGILSNISSMYSDLVRNSQRTIESIDIEIAALSITIHNQPIVDIGYIKELWDNGEIEAELSAYTRVAHNIIINCLPLAYNNQVLSVGVSNQQLANSMRSNDRKSILEKTISRVVGINIQIEILSE